MTGQQPGVPGQPGDLPRQDQESTQVGMPVPPSTPGYVQQPPYGQPYGTGTAYGGQPPAYPPPPPGYPPQQPGYPPQQPGYGTPGGYPPAPVAGYGYGTPPPRRGGPSGLLIGAFALLIVLAIGVAVLYFGKLGPFATSSGTPQPTRTAQASPTPSRAPQTASPTSALPTPTATLPPTVAPPTAYRRVPAATADRRAPSAATGNGTAICSPAAPYRRPTVAPSPYAPT
jgi:hypothetical protein